MREGYLDAPGVKSILDPAEELPAHCPLLDGFCLQTALDDDGGIAEFVNPEDLGHLEHELTEICVTLHLTAYLFDNLHHLVGVFLVGDPQVEDIT